jgi:hypothetical protein
VFVGVELNTERVAAACPPMLIASGESDFVRRMFRDAGERRPREIAILAASSGETQRLRD